MTAHLVLKAQELARHAKKIAARCGCYVVPKAVPNPTLERHGLTAASRWHLLTHEPPRRPVADLYAGTRAEAARVARLFAELLGVQLDLLDNTATPADLKAHPRAVISPGVGVNPRSRSGLSRAVRKVGRIIAGGSARIRKARGAKRLARMASRSRRLTARGFHGAATNPPRMPRKQRRALASGRFAKAQHHAARSIERGATRAAARRAAGSRAFYGRLRNPEFKFDWQRDKPDSLGRRTFAGWRAHTSIGDYYLSPVNAGGTDAAKLRGKGKLLGYVLQLNGREKLENGYLWKEVGSFGPRELAKAKRAAHDDFLERVLTGDGHRANPKGRFPSMDAYARALKKYQAALARARKAGKRLTQVQRDALWRSLGGQADPRRNPSHSEEAGQPIATLYGRPVLGDGRGRPRVFTDREKAERVWHGLANDGNFELGRSGRGWVVRYLGLGGRPPLEGERWRRRATRRNPLRRNLSVADQHLLKIARATLRMNDVFARIMGGPSKDESREIIYRLTGTRPKETNPRVVGEHDVRAAIAGLLEQGGFAGLAGDVVGGADPVKALTIAARASNEPSRTFYTRAKSLWTRWVAGGKRLGRSANPKGRKRNPGGKIKVALRREPGYPIGQPAPMHTVCACGQRIDLPVGGPREDFSCASCGRTWSPGGWLVNEKNPRKGRTRVSTRRGVSSRSTARRRTAPRRRNAGSCSRAASGRASGATPRRQRQPVARGRRRRRRAGTVSALKNPRPYVVGEVVTVPYTGRSSYFGRRVKRTRESATVQGQNADGTVLVTVKRGKSYEQHSFDPKHVRHRPRTGAAAGQARIQSVKARLDVKADRARLAATRKQIATLEREARCVEAQAKAVDMVPDSREYKALRAKLVRLEREILAARAVAAELEQRDPRYVDPWGPSPTARAVANPRSSVAEEKAAAVVRKFQDRGAIAVRKKRMRAPRPLKGAAAELGKLIAVTYESDKFDGKTRHYEHVFVVPPSLVTDPEGQGLHVVGGAYKITPDGIVN